MKGLRPAIRSAMRPAPGRPCLITSTCARIGCTRCRPRTGRTAPTRRPLPPATRAGCAAQHGPKTTARRPPSTCCCSASGRTAMSRRCCPGSPRSTTIGPWWRCTARPSRRRSGCPSRCPPSGPPAKCGSRLRKRESSGGVARAVGGRPGPGARGGRDRAAADAVPAGPGGGRPGARAARQDRLALSSRAGSPSQRCRRPGGRRGRRGQLGTYRYRFGAYLGPGPGSAG